MLGKVIVALFQIPPPLVTNDNPFSSLYNVWLPSVNKPLFIIVNNVPSANVTFPFGLEARKPTELLSLIVTTESLSKVALFNKRIPENKFTFQACHPLFIIFKFDLITSKFPATFNAVYPFPILLNLVLTNLVSLADKPWPALFKNSTVELIAVKLPPLEALPVQFLTINVEFST